MQGNTLKISSHLRTQNDFILEEKLTPAQYIIDLLKTIKIGHVAANDERMR
jgi:hypothetical protein